MKFINTFLGIIMLASLMSCNKENITYGDYLVTYQYTETAYYLKDSILRDSIVGQFSKSDFIQIRETDSADSISVRNLLGTFHSDVYAQAEGDMIYAFDDIKLPDTSKVNETLEGILSLDRDSIQLNYSYQNIFSTDTGEKTTWSIRGLGYIE